MSDSIFEGMDLYEWRASCKRAENQRDEVQKALRDARAEVARLNELVFAYESVRAPVNPLLAEVKALREALKRYGAHSDTCPFRLSYTHDPCACGFSEAAKAAKETPWAREEGRK